MAVIPQSKGLIMVGDTPSFVSHPVNWISDRQKKHGDIFRGNILGKQTVFVCGYELVDELLARGEESGISVKEGYKEFMSNFFPDSILLTEGELWSRMRKSLDVTFCDCYDRYFHATQDVSRELFKGLEIEKPIDTYSFFKEMVSKIMLWHLTSGEGDQVETHKRIKDHFHALCGLPIDFSIPILGFKSTYQKGLEAGEYLDEHFDQRLKAERSKSHASKASQGEVEQSIEQLKNIRSENGSKEPIVVDRKSCGPNCGRQSFLNRMVEAQDEGHHEASEEEMKRNLMLLSSSLVPKSVAALITNAVVLLAFPENKSILQNLQEEQSIFHGQQLKVEDLTHMPYLDAFFREMARLYPSVIGGVRTAVDNALIGGHVVEKGWRVWYSSLHANRDPVVYKDPETFNPDRWLVERDQQPRAPHTFADRAKRTCAGKNFVRIMFEVAIVTLLRNYTWGLASSTYPIWRYMPVVRPKDGGQLIFYKNITAP
eukprot:Clim_evm130s210 gene=Clim_evmTU130s210